MEKKRSISLVDLQGQYRAIRKEIDQAFQAVMERGQFILGPEVETLEKEVAASCRTQRAVGTASGTDALELSLRAFGIGEGDEVIVPAFTFLATALAVRLAGAAPVFVDIEPKTYTIDPAQIRKAITPRSKAILPVHLFGHPCNMEEILSIAKSSHLKVLEDCAQAIGATVNGQPVGSFGDAGALSFYPSKNLGAYGDGGMVVTNDAALADRLEILRWYGMRDRSRAEQLGRNSRLDELQAAILRVKLRHLDRWNEARRRNAKVYQQAFQQQPLKELILPQELPGYRHVYHLYPIRIPQRDRVREALVAQGIGAQIHYDCILPEQPIFQPTPGTNRSFPVAQAVARDELSLPMYPELSTDEIQRVVQVLSNAAAGSPLPDKAV